MGSHPARWGAALSWPPGSAPSLLPGASEHRPRLPRRYGPLARARSTALAGASTRSGTDHPGMILPAVVVLHESPLADGRLARTRDGFCKSVTGCQWISLTLTRVVDSVPPPAGPLSFEVVEVGVERSCVADS